MFPQYQTDSYVDRLPRPDRRPVATASEIRLRVRRGSTPKAA
jgi:hypothetical protein